MSQKTHIMDNDRIGKLLCQFSMPAMVGIMVMALYNIIDTIFVGRFVGTTAIASLTIANPIQALIGGFGQMIGVGGASLMSRSLGARDYETSGKTLGNVLFLTITLGILFSVLGTVFLKPLLFLFGAAEDTFGMAQSYLRIIILNAAFPITAMSLNNLVRAEGHARVAMSTMLISSISNIILDAVFIIGFKWGVRGAAWATILSHIISASFLFYFILFRQSTLKISWQNMKPDFKIFKEIFGIGIANFLRQSAMSLVTVIINRTILLYGTAMDIAVFGIMFRIIMIVFTPLLGVSMGMQPLAGFNYGAKRFDRLKRVIRISTISSTILSTSGAILIYLFARPIFYLFSSDPDFIETGCHSIRLIVLAFPLVGFQVAGTTVFQALGKTIPNFILSLSRQIFLLIPAVLIFSRIFQLDGIWIAFPISDVLSVMLTATLFIRLMREISRDAKNQEEIQ